MEFVGWGTGKGRREIGGLGAERLWRGCREGIGNGPFGA